MSHLAMLSHSIAAINATFDFLFYAKNTKSRNELHNGLLVTVSLARTNIFLCNSQTVHNIHEHMMHSHGNKTKSRARYVINNWPTKSLLYITTIVIILRWRLFILITIELIFLVYLGNK